MNKVTTWIYGQPNPDILDPKCWTNGVPGSGDKIIVPGHKTECFPPKGCKNTNALEGLTLGLFVKRGGGVTMTKDVSHPIEPAGIVPSETERQNNERSL